MSIPGVTQRDLRHSYDAVIVGAGIQGIALGYELASRGMESVAVVDASWPGSGASGRNGEIIRSAFSSREWMGLFDLGLKRWRELSAELDFNTLFTPGGDLLVAINEDEVRELRDLPERHRAAGVHSEWLEPLELRKLVPAIDPELLAGGLWQPHAGFAHHDAGLWGYARAAARRGVEIHAHTPLEAVEVTGGKVRSATIAGRRVNTPVIVNAAGAFAREVAAMATVEIPTRRYLLEILVTESLQPFLRPAVSSLALMSYCHQTSRGEFVGGTEFKPENPWDDTVVTLEALRDMTGKFVRLFPQLAGARVVRHWSGLVDSSPDGAPILGPAPGVEGFFLDCGWAYGFMGAPASAELLARWILEGHPDPVIAPFDPDRFRTGRLIEEGVNVVPLEDPADGGEK